MELNTLSNYERFEGIFNSYLSDSHLSKTKMTDEELKKMFNKYIGIAENIINTPEQQVYKVYNLHDRLASQSAFEVVQMHLKNKREDTLAKQRILHRIKDNLLSKQKLNAEEIKVLHFFFPNYKLNHNSPYIILSDIGELIQGCNTEWSRVNDLESRVFIKIGAGIRDN